METCYTCLHESEKKGLLQSWEAQTSPIGIRSPRDVTETVSPWPVEPKPIFNLEYTSDTPSPLQNSDIRGALGVGAAKTFDLMDEPEGGNSTPVMKHYQATEGKNSVKFTSVSKA